MHNQPIHTLIFAQTIGLFLIIMTIIMVSRAKYYRALIKSLKANDNIIPVSSSISLIFGLVLIVMHNIWVMESDTLIAVVGWILVIKSVLWLSLPERMLAIAHKIYGSCWYYIMAVLVAIAGLLLLTHGYYLFMPKWVVVF